VTLPSHDHSISKKIHKEAVGCDVNEKGESTKERKDKAKRENKREKGRRKEEEEEEEESEEDAYFSNSFMTAF